MEKLKKGDVLYDLFLEALCKKGEDELVDSYKTLGQMRENHDCLLEKMNDELEKDVTLNGLEKQKKEDAYLDAFYYNTYQFIAWLNLVL